VWLAHLSGADALRLVLQSAYDPRGRDSQCDHDQVESGSVDDSVVRRAHSVTKGARPVDLASGLLV